MTDLDYLMDDIRDAVDSTLFGLVENEKKEAIVDKVRALITPKFDGKQEEIDDLEREVDNLENELSDLSDACNELEGELETQRDEKAEKEWLVMVEMFRRAGGHVNDVRYGYPAAY